MQEVTPDPQLRTMFILDRHGRISSTREPQATAGPIFTLIRSASTSAWAIRADMPTELAGKLDRLAREEPPILDPRESPVNADQYLSLCGGKVDCGPAFSFPDEIGQPTDVAIVNELKLLQRNFRGWVASEIPGRSPIYAVTDGSFPVSICFSARNAETAAEAGVETAAAFRGRGFASRVTAVWAAAIRATGRIPLYSTSWSNSASLAVAHKLGLIQYASDWSVSPL